MRRFTWGVITAAVALLGSESPAGAGGFRVEAQGAAALGQGLAFTASIEDPTIVYYNPAGLTALPATQAAVHGNWIMVGTHFTNRNATPPFIPANQTEGDQNPPSFPSGLYVTNDLGLDLALGLGVFSPYGLALDRSTTGNTRFTMTHALLQTVDVNPVAALRLHPALSAAVGLDVIGASAELERAVRVSPTAAARVRVRDATDVGVGSTVSLSGVPHPAWRWGVVYRSQVRLNLRGRVHADTTPAIDQDATLALTVPHTVSGGVAYAVTPSWTVAADGVWTDWSSTTRFDLATSTPLPAAASSSRRGWRDTWGARIGVRHQLAPSWTLRTGYYWNPTPVPAQTLDALLPDANRHEVGVGAGYAWARARVDLAYTRIFLADRTTDFNENDPTAAGTYRSRIDILAVTASYRF